MPRKGEEQRRKIVSAANRLFYEQGFHATSLTDIAQGCAIPKGNFYFYFKSKDDILDAVAGDRIDRLRRLLRDWEDEFAEPLDRLVRASEMIVREGLQITRYGCPTGSLLLELSKQERELERNALPLFDLLLEWLERQFALIAGPDTAPALSRRMLVRMQGASILSAVHDDSAWLIEEQQSIVEWLRDIARPDP